MERHLVAETGQASRDVALQAGHAAAELVGLPP
jgi:hypothetical protein